MLLVIVSALFQREFIVDTVGTDAGNSPYTVFTYSQSIYQYEYTYLFKWRQKKDIAYDPGTIPMNSQRVYIIIPSISESIK